ncbi:acyltransferase family protein [Arthrobacter humicola]
MSHADYVDQRRFLALDGLRAISILLVFTAHPASQVFWPMLHGAAGVTYFFVLSGFLITTLLLREEVRNGATDLRAFYIRRVFRIYPMYFAILALYCVVILILGMQSERRDAFVENIPYFILFFPEHSMFFNPNSFSIPFNASWSIGIEEKFYLVWPVLGFVLLRSWKVGRLPVLIAMGVSLFVLGFAGGGWDVVTPYQHIVYGAIVAVLLQHRPTYDRLAVIGQPRVLMAITILTVALQFGTAAILPGQPLYGAFGVVVATLLAGLVTTKSRAVGWLSSRPMVYLGALSYVIYLTHNFVINGAEMLVPERWGFPGSLLSTMLAFAAAVLVAHFIHKYFEEPMRLVGVRLAKRKVGPRSERTHVPDHAR